MPETARKPVALAAAALSLFAFSTAPSVAQAEILFVACDNGLRCVKAPCPTRDALLLTSGRRLARTAPDLSTLTPAERQRITAVDALYHGTIVFAGTLRDGTPIATRIARDATTAEAALCRKVR